MAKRTRPVTRLAGAALMLLLAACAAPGGGATEGEGAQARAAAVAELEAMGMRNIAALKVTGPISEGYGTYQAERVRFLYDSRDGNLRTWDFMPPVP